MCNRDDKEIVLLPRSPWLGGGETYVEIDKCLVSIVKALNMAGIKTSSCCCGHGEPRGWICLEDGRCIEYRDTRKRTQINRGWVDIRVTPPHRVIYAPRD